MSTVEKLKGNLKNRPATYKWNDIKRVLTNLGYKEDSGGKTSGARVKFIHATAALIIIHKPHPGNELKKYIIDFIVDTLEQEGLL